MKRLDRKDINALALSLEKIASVSLPNRGRGSPEWCGIQRNFTESINERSTIIRLPFFPFGREARSDMDAGIDVAISRPDWQFWSAIVKRTVTVAIEIDHEPASVFRLASTVTYLPQWAPEFADRVTKGAGDDWIITKGDSQFSIHVEADPTRGTIDFLREVAPGQVGGAYLRVMPRPGGGSVVAMTLPVPPSGSANKVVAVAKRELLALSALVVSGAPS
ncbi:MAG: hypothetical protein ACTHKR_12160 [Sphingomonas sp.]